MKNLESARESEPNGFERDAPTRNLLINLAADARSFNDMMTAAELWRALPVSLTADPERARTIFHFA
jgi:hypothetical protein